MDNASAKPAHDLTEVDFARAPAWQFILDGEASDECDESYVRPAVEPLTLGNFGSFKIRAHYTLANGQEFPGAVQVDLLDRRANFTPVCLFVGKQSVDPLAADAGARIERIAKRLNARPVKWRLAVLFTGEVSPRSGRISRHQAFRALGLLIQLLRLHLTRGGK